MKGFQGSQQLHKALGLRNRSNHLHIGRQITVVTDYINDSVAGNYIELFSSLYRLADLTLAAFLQMIYSQLQGFTKKVSLKKGYCFKLHSLTANELS